MAARRRPRQHATEEGPDDVPAEVVLGMDPYVDVVLREPAPKHGEGRPVDPARLGISGGLRERIDAWEARYFELAGKPYDPPPVQPEQLPALEEAMAAWRRGGLDLACDLQHELAALGLRIDVRYGEDGDDRPVSGRRGR